MGKSASVTGVPIIRNMPGRNAGGGWWDQPPEAPPPLQSWPACRVLPCPYLDPCKTAELPWGVAQSRE
jgi:hypothetical protein